MIRYARIFFLLFATVLIAVACRHELLDAGDADLTIWLDIDAPRLTKADLGEVTAEDAENAINDLRIWVFLHGDFTGDHNEYDNFSDGMLLGYINPRNNNGSGADGDPLTNYENKYHIRLPREIARAEHMPKVDVYAIGNVASILPGNATLPAATTTRDQLDALLISGEFFGVNEAGGPACTSVPEAGLPFSGVGKNLTMKGSYPVLSVDVVTIRRAVSKFRFVLCQIRDEVGPMINNLQITELALDGPNIALEESLFLEPGTTYNVNGHVLGGIDFLTGRDPHAISNSETEVINKRQYYVLRTNPNPMQYAYAGQSAQEYETLIQEGVQNEVLKEWGNCYLRETEGQLTGHISYKLNGEMRPPVVFYMDAAGDFVRGRSWIVYIYFLRESMQFTVSWTPWGDGLSSPLDVYDLTPHE